MSLFSKLTKNNSEKQVYPWSNKKLGGSHHTVPRFGHTATCLSSDNIVVFGGIHKGSGKKELCYIDTNALSANHISTQGDIPTARKYCTIVGMGNFVLLYGGEPTNTNDQWDPHLYALNLNNRYWQRVKMEGAIPPERSGHTAVAIGGIMYIWGGQHHGRYYNEVLAFNTSNYSDNPHWDLIHNGNNDQGPIPTGRSGHTSVVFENRLYIFGGSDGKHLYNDIWCFDFHSRQWHQIPAAGFIPTAREHAAAGLVDDAMYVIGGRDVDGNELNDLCAFRIRSQRWYMFQNMGPSPTPRHSASMTSVKDKLFVIGGELKLGTKPDDNSSIYILDSGKIKYPPEVNAPPQQQSMQQQQSMTQSQSQQQQLSLQQSVVSNHSPTSSAFSLPDPDMVASTASSINQQQHQQQQQQQQLQSQPQQQIRNHTPSPSSNSLSTPLRSQPQSPTHNNNNNNNNNVYENGHPVENNNNNNNMNSSMNVPQPSSSSPVPGSNARQKPYHPELQVNNQQQPPRPPRHVSTVPEAALRRPRTTSPLPTDELSSPVESVNDMKNQHFLTAAVDETGTIDPYMHHPSSNTPTQSTPPPHSTSSTPTSLMNRVMSPPPRPSREGVKLNPEMMDSSMTPPPPSLALAQQQQQQQKPTSQLRYSNDNSSNHSNNSNYNNQQPYQHSNNNNAYNPSQQQQYHQRSLNASPQQQQLPNGHVSSSTSSSPHIDNRRDIMEENIQSQATIPSSSTTPPPISPPSTTITPSNSMPSIVSQQQQQQHVINRQRSNSNTSAKEENERTTLMREIKARDLIISEMKKKEQWWRTEVSLARKLRPKQFDMNQDNTNEDALQQQQNEDELMLMDLNDAEEDKVKLFEQLVTVKAELRRVRQQITQQAQPMSDKVAQADRMRTAALQEAMYFKSKYSALKTQIEKIGRQQEDGEENNGSLLLLEKIENERIQELEKKLVIAYSENEKNMKLMQQWQRKAQHDHSAKLSAEERSKDAHTRAEEAQVAYQRSLEDVDIWHTRAIQAEEQYHESTLKIADLSTQLSQALQAVAKAAAEAESVAKEKSLLQEQQRKFMMLQQQHDDELHSNDYHLNNNGNNGDHHDALQLKLSRLEANYFKSRNEVATLQQRMADAMDEIARLKSIIMEKDESLQEAQAQLEDADIQLVMLREQISKSLN
ncbi:hypothetical protein BJ944DRAFT_237469 [Cunninghamella echinulata]|nr:hypothetical protein BJ944DRAFT_237469 [Cunninghamella echinulata]